MVYSSCIRYVGIFSYTRWINLNNAMKPLEILTVIAIIVCTVFINYLIFDYQTNVQLKQASYDSLEAQINSRNAIIDSLFKRKAVIIEQHQHNTKKYYENHYTIIAANDSATRSTLFSNIARFEYLHRFEPGQNN
jgi:hypothetical protein